MMFLALTLALAAPAQRQPLNLYGFPGASCADWTTGRRKENADGHALEGWVLGLISGLNAFGTNNGNIAPGTSATGLLGWVDNYCAANPLDSMFTAGLRLAGELKKRAKT